MVESKQGTGEWVPATEVPANKLDAKVTLIPGKTYQFRVKAINKAGESAPSDPSRTLLAKSRKRKARYRGMHGRCVMCMLD